MNATEGSAFGGTVATFSDPDGGETHAEPVQQTASHHPHALVREQERAEYAARDAQHEDHKLFRGDRHRPDRPSMRTDGP